MDTVEAIERGRCAYDRRAWADAYRSLSLADEAAPLEVADLERLATSAYLVGRGEEYLEAVERAYHAYSSAGRSLDAARSAFWLGLNLLFREQTARASGWLSRAHRLLGDRNCVERGYLLLPAAEQALVQGHPGAAHEMASDAASIGDRFRDADLTACARHVQGRAFLKQGRTQEGLRLLDEAMVAVVSGELSPIMTGLIYCSVIDACQQAYAVARAREWTSALAHWCERQPEMVAFTTTCLVHRAELMQLNGAWTDAIEEAQRACDRREPPAAAFYQRGEVHRLRGEFAEAEEAYRSASQMGRDPQPGLSLLRTAQGRTRTATSAISRALRAVSDPLERSKLLPAYVEIMLEVDDIEAARNGLEELARIATDFENDVIAAMARSCQGAVQLAEGDPVAALRSLRGALRTWQEVKMPYPAARVRMLTAIACRAVGDEEGCSLELEAATAVFKRLGAAPDLARIGSLAQGPSAGHELTSRQLEVLRLIAAGETNKAIARELHLSERTVERHVSNILTRLDLPSRTAATAYAYEHKLI